MVKPASVTWFLQPSKEEKEFSETANNRRNYYPLNTGATENIVNSWPSPKEEINSKSQELPATMDIRDQNQASGAETSSKTPEELNMVSPEKLAYILIGVCCGLSILCLIIVAISIGYNKSETQYRFSGGGGGVKVSKSIKLIKASSSDMKSNSSTSSSGSSGATSEAEEVDTEGQHSLQVINER